MCPWVLENLFINVSPDPFHLWNFLAVNRLALDLKPPGPKQLAFQMDSLDFPELSDSLDFYVGFLSSVCFNMTSPLLFATATLPSKHLVQVGQKYKMLAVRLSSSESK